MQFLARLRDAVRRGEIDTSIRIWQSPRVRVGGRYWLAPGHVVVDSVREILLEEVTDAMARDSGFEDVADLLATTRHGRGSNVYLVRFHYRED